MQPLISPVDHESRHGSNHADDEVRSASEHTPLLQRRYPRANHRANAVTFGVVGMMVAIMLSGLSIGVYLLITEDNTRNRIPPIQMPPHFVARSEWDAMSPYFSESLPVFEAKTVIIEQTETAQCEGEDDCIKLMKEMEENIDENKTLPYNFMVSSDGFIYEYLGWERASPLYPELSSLAIALIGDFTEEKPPARQIQSAGNLITASVSNEYLDRNFTIITNGTIFASDSVQKSLLDQFESAMERRRLYKLYFFKSEG